MLKQTLFIDIWTALYQLAIHARSNAIAALLAEEKAYRLLYSLNPSQEAIQTLSIQQPLVICVNGLITRNELAPHHLEYLTQEISAHKNYIK